MRSRKSWPVVSPSPQSLRPSASREMLDRIDTGGEGEGEENEEEEEEEYDEEEVEES